MLFNSLNFALFLPIVFVLYWFPTKGKLKHQNVILLFSSYFFYSCWDWRFLFLLIFSTILDYFTGIKIYETTKKKQKKLWLWISIGINLGFLGVFKYYNFFAISLVEAISNLGYDINLETLQIVLPVGISFYTFHGLSYIIDIYKNRIKPQKNFIDYSIFVSFFPLLVAGPIERATHLLPQIIKKREFDYSKTVDGLRQILWGLFKKIVIADNFAEYANIIFNNYTDYSGSTLILGSLLFTFQIYCDFSGYSDIALGTARLLGFELIQNFSFPYFSRNITEFWRRWHISLSSWFRDYIYIPLGGNKVGILLKIRNTFIIFLASGLWHGANWTFVVWGCINAIYILPSLIFNPIKNNLDIVAKGKIIPSLKEILKIGLTFCLTVFAWIFFRSENLNQAYIIISRIFSSSTFSFPFINEMNTGSQIFPKSLILLIIIFTIIEWYGREDKYALENILKFRKKFTRYVFYIVIILLIFYQGNFNENTFIYFQF